MCGGRKYGCNIAALLGNGIADQLMLGAGNNEGNAINTCRATMSKQASKEGEGRQIKGKQAWKRREMSNA